MHNNNLFIYCVSFRLLDYIDITDFMINFE